jgi:16S rRNA (cytidine1402-2'-O)-methyltransferase
LPGVLFPASITQPELSFCRAFCYNERRSDAMATLYVVATPIGNLEDITLRALRILREVGLIAAEDTRSARTLLSRHGISTPVTSYYEHNKLIKLETILAALDKHDVVLISEAGMPGISDPGYELVCAALARGITVTPIPGPSAIVSALAVSGLPTDRFLFLGFLPRQKAERRRALREIAAERSTLIAYEAPHRLLDTLEDILAILGDRRIAAARELTKLFEEIQRGTVSEVLAHFRETPPRGEFTLVVEGKREQAEHPSPSAEQVRQRLAELARQGVPPSEAARLVASETGLPRREVYRAAVSGKRAGSRQQRAGSKRPA